MNGYTGGCNPSAVLGIVFEMARCAPDGGSLSASCGAAVSAPNSCADAGA